MRPFDFALLGFVIFGWSTSWLPLKWQAVPGVAPEVSVMWRFLIAGVIMMIFALATNRWKLAPHHHWMAIVMGVCIFSTNFTLFYYGAYSVTSGLLAVVFALASIINLFYSRLVFGTKVTAIALGAAGLGVAGVAMMYWPEIAGGSSALVALGFCVSGTILFCTGSQISSLAQRRGIAVVPITAWGMCYGAVAMALLALVRGKEFTWEVSWTYLGGTVWLAIFSSIIAFGAFLTLIGRIGPGRAAYATVLFPPFALLISTVVEGYQWTTLSFLGLVSVLAGLVLLTRSR